MILKKITLLVLLIVCGAVAYYLYVDTNPPVIAWGVEENASINAALTIHVTDDQGLSEVCYTLSGGRCAGDEICSSASAAQSFDLRIEPEQCAVDSEPLGISIAVTAEDTSVLPNQTSGTINLTFDNQAPTLVTLSGTRYLKRGGAGVVLYEVGEVPERTGVLLDDLLFRAFEVAEKRYLSFYAHPYDVEPDQFKPRVFAVDRAGNLRKIRPGSSTASKAYKKEEILLSDDFLELVKDKMLATSSLSPLEAFVDVNQRIRGENYRKIVEVCQDSEAKKLWDGAFLRNRGAGKAGFADSRTYRYQDQIVSQQVHTGIDIAGINNTEILAANHGRVAFVGEIGIYGNVVILDHGYGVHSLYGHLSQIGVRQGDRVGKGDVIAASGETGLAFGDHLHFEIRVNGVPVNPIEWFDDVWVHNNIETFLPGSL